MVRDRDNVHIVAEVQCERALYSGLIDRLGFLTPSHSKIHLISRTLLKFVKVLAIDHQNDRLASHGFPLRLHCANPPIPTCVLNIEPVWVLDDSSTSYFLSFNLA